MSATVAERLEEKYRLVQSAVKSGLDKAISDDVPVHLTPVSRQDAIYAYVQSTDIELSVGNEPLVCGEVLIAIPYNQTEIDRNTGDDPPMEKLRRIACEVLQAMFDLESPYISMSPAKIFYSDASDTMFLRIKFNEKGINHDSR